jgi:restriction endonuclease S subunit
MSKQGTEAPDQPMPEKALKELFGQSHDRGRAGLPVMSLSMGRGLVPRNQDERRVETNLSDEQHRLVRAGELAYNMMRMWQGVCGLAEEDCLISPAYVVVRPLNGMDPKFSEYLLTYEETVAQFKLLSFGVVDDRLRLYFKDFERVRVRIPSPPAQRKIARILTTLDNLIENTEALIAKYQAIKQGMMHDLFSRGIDAHGHLRPSLSEAPALYRQSELGWIPKNWEARRLGDVANLQVGYAFKSSWFRDQGEVRLLRGENVGYGRPDWSDAKFLSSTMVEQFPEYTLHPGDVVIGMDRTFTKTGVKITQLRAQDCPALLVQRVGRFLPKQCEAEFMRGLLGYERYHADLARQQKGMDIPHLSQSEILEPLIPVPPIDEQARIAARQASLDATIASECEHLGKMTRTKTALMQDLLTGKVRVKADETEEAPANA